MARNQALKHSIFVLINILKQKIIAAMEILKLDVDISFKQKSCVARGRGIEGLLFI